MVWKWFHADGLGALGLPGVDGDDAAPNRLGHISARVDGHHHNGRSPDAGPLGAAEVGQAVVDEHRLEHHGRTPEDLHIDPDDDPDELEEKALEGRILGRIGDGIEHAAGKADDAADDRGHHGQYDGALDAVEIPRPIILQQQHNIVTQV